MWSLRGENFRWADLVSGNLKEVEATSLSTLTLRNAIVKPPEPLAAIFALLFRPAPLELIEL
jgi:hypothetical protein